MCTKALKQPYDQNRYEYNGIEYDTAFGLDEYEAHYRDLDPQIGRWTTIDPKIEKDQESSSPYVSMDNNPARLTDPKGDVPCCETASLVWQATENLASRADPETETEIMVGGAVLAAGAFVLDVMSESFAGTSNGNAYVPLSAQLQQRAYHASLMKASKMTLTDAEKAELKRPFAKPADIKNPEKTGSIYKVPGSATKSGKPYVGRHNKPNPAKTRKSNDGRDRTKAEVIDKYDPSNTQEGRTKEQKAIDDNGGKDNLDNKRNEIKK